LIIKQHNIMLTYGFIEPLYSTNRTELSNNLYRKCYWYFIKNNILSTKNILDAKKDKIYTKLDRVISVIYNHLCIDNIFDLKID